jgi:hypothetical protein
MTDRNEPDHIDERTFLQSRSGSGLPTIRPEGSTGQNHTSFAIRDECANTITDPDPRN